MGWAARIPTSGGTKPVKRYGYPSRKDAVAAAEQAGRLLDLAPDEVTRRKIGDLIVSARLGAALPALKDVRRRLGLGLGLGLEPGQPGITVGGWMAAGQHRARVRAAHPAVHQAGDR